MLAVLYRCVIISHCGFSLQFLDDQWSGTYFHRLIRYLWWKVFSCIFACFLIVLLLNFESCLYVLDINPVSGIWFRNFFHFVACIFIFTVSLRAKFFYFNVIPNISFPFMDHVISVKSINSLTDLDFQYFLLWLLFLKVL